MTLAILYTSFRQLEELQLYPDMLNRNPHTSEADVIYHNNNPAFTTTQIEEALCKVPYKSLKIIHSPQKNAGGYPYGQFEAILDSWDILITKGYDWVIHLHPDIFLIDESKLLAEIDHATSSSADILVTATFGHTAPAYATDFFCFRPARVLKSLFESYLPLLKAPIVVPLEYLFYNEIFRAKLKTHVAVRFLHGHYHRDIDQLGLWHEHNLLRVRLYMQNPNSRWRTLPASIAKSPYRAFRIYLKYVRRRCRRESQDSIGAQLTVL